MTRRWARRGTRPSAPHDQRTAWAYIFGAICPAKGKGAGLVLPYCNTEAMAAQLEEISQAVAPGAHAVLLLDQAGWHVSPKLTVPANITLLPLPPRSPELNPVENVWLRTSGSSFATTGCRTGSSALTSRSSIIAARLGTSSSTSPGSSCPSACATGLTGSDQCTLV